MRAGNSSEAAAEEEAEEALELPDCCSYDQVYGKIIELLERAASAGETALSRALAAELKVSEGARRSSERAAHDETGQRV